MDALLALDIDEELLATCGALGYTEDDQYYKGEECWECMKDLIGFLKRDTSSCLTRRQLGCTQILQTDLLSILVNFWEDENLLNACIKLLVNLTLPAFLCMDSSYPGPKDVQANKIYLELNTYLVQYKEAFANNQVMKVIGHLLTSLCQKPPDDRSPDETTMVERLLILIRNVLHIPSVPNQEQRTDKDVNLHDELLWNLHINGIDEMLIYISSSSHEREWVMHVLEIMFLMLREQSASCLATTGEQLTESQRREEDRDFAIMVERELQQKRMKLKQRSTRHSRFGGTFIMTSLRALDEKERLVYHKSLSGVKNHSLDTEKRRVKVNKLRMAAAPQSGSRIPAYTVRQMLKGFCVNFLECSYNSLMKIAKDMIMRDRHVEHDETYYLWALRFFMEFNRLYNLRVDWCRETLSSPIIHFVMGQLLKYCDETNSRKARDARPWSRRLHNAVQAYYQLLEFCYALSVHEDPGMRENAEILLTNTFYMPEYRDALVTLARTYDGVKSDKEYLKDVIKLIHLYLKSIQHYCNNNRHILVQKKRVRRTRKRNVAMTEERVYGMWQECEPSVVESLQPGAELPMCEAPHDATSDIPLDEQKDFAVEKLIALLREKKVSECVATFKACKDAWPDGTFEAVDATPEANLNVLREMFVAHRGHVEEEENVDEEEEQAVETSTSRELEFDLDKYIRRFSNQKIVRNYALILADYRLNSSHVNHCVVKMLHRTAVKYEMAPYLYHISVLRTMDRILNDPAAHKIKELVDFARYIVKGFFRCAKENPAFYADALFWKTQHDLFRLLEGDEVFERRRTLKKIKTLWTFEQEEELRELFEKHKGSDDIIGSILDDLSTEPPRSRRQVSTQLIRMQLVTDRKQLHKKKRKRVGRGKVSLNKRPKGGLPWTGEEIARLEDLFFEHHAAVDRVTVIASEFTTKNMDEIAAKLEELGLIDPTENDFRRHGADSNDNDTDSSSSDDDDDDDRGGHSKRSENQAKKNPRSRVAVLKDFSQWQNVLNEVQEAGFRNQLEWMAENLRGEEIDRTIEKDNWQNLPIVPLHSDQMNAMENERFCRLLRVIGLSAPIRGQEAYWRIPDDLQPEELSHAAGFLEGKLRASSPPPPPPAGDDRAPPSPEPSPLLPEPSPASLSDDLPGNQEEGSPTGRQPSKPAEKRMSALKELRSKRNQKKTGDAPKAKRKVVLEDDDDDDDADCSGAGTFDDDLISTLTPCRRRNILDENDSDDENTPRRPAKKSHFILEDDSD